MCETKVSLVRALAARYKANTGGGVLPVTLGVKLEYRAYAHDAQLRALHFQEQPDAGVFERRARAPWEAALAALPGGLGGGPVPTAAAEPANGGGGGGGVVARAYAAMERLHPFHELQADRVSLVVSVPVPRALKLADLLSEAERRKLRAKGFLRA